MKSSDNELPVPYPGKFLVTFPLWIHVQPAAGVKGLVRVNAESGDIANPLFTDKDLAERFRDTFLVDRNNEHVLAIIESAAMLAGYLTDLEMEGFTHVTIDQRHDIAKLLPIEELRASIKNKVD